MNSQGKQGEETGDCNNQSCFFPNAFFRVSSQQIFRFSGKFFSRFLNSNVQNIISDAFPYIFSSISSGGGFQSSIFPAWIKVLRSFHQGLLNGFHIRCINWRSYRLKNLLKGEVLKKCSVNRVVLLKNGDFNVFQL